MFCAIALRFLKSISAVEDIFYFMKVLYYIQCCFILEKQRPCYFDTIEAAPNGPILPTPRDLYRFYRSSPLEKALPPFSGSIDDADKELINRVCLNCMDYNFMELSSKTHEDKPWQDADERAKNNQDITIPLEDLLHFYSENPGRLDFVRKSA
jgi:uncharacterized phage-associated protein